MKCSGSALAAAKIKASNSFADRRRYQLPIHKVIGRHLICFGRSPRVMGKYGVAAR